MRRRHLFLIFFLLLGVIRGLAWRPHLPTAYFDSEYDICGTIGSPTDLGRKRISVLIEKLTIDQKEVPGRLQVSMSFPRKRESRKIDPRFRGDDSLANLLVGSRICFSGIIREIRNFGTPGEFDGARKMHSRGIWGRVFLSSRDPQPLVAQPRVAEGRGISSYPIQKLRERFLRELDRFSEAGNLIKMVILGIPAMTPDQKKDFITTGLLHVIVISGQNIALLFFFSYSLFYWLFSRSSYLLLRWPLQNVLIVLSSVILLFFYFFCGSEIPILRASLMAFSQLITLWSSRPQSGLYALSVTAALILNFVPSALLDPSFQLSFFAVLGLCLLRFFDPDVYKSIWKTMLFSTGVCTFITAPLVIYYFHRFSPIGLFANLFVTPIISFFILPASFLATFVYFISGPVFGLLMTIFEPIARLLFSFVHLWALVGVAVPFGSLVIPSFSPIGLVKSSDLRISFISVGQGDATLLELPGGKTVLVDAGGMGPSFDVGERLLAPYLWKRGIHSIDVVALTHSDFDHIDGARFLIDQFEVGEIWVSQWKGGIHYEQILGRAEDKNIPIFLFSRKSPIKNLSGVEFYFLNPKDPFEYASDNHQSLVFRCRYKNFSALFTADIEKDIEEELAGFPLQSTVLKVPHHGSKSSSSFSFLRSVKPKLALISAGYANRFGHPHESVVRRYRDLGIRLFRTDQQGTTEIRTDGVDQLAVVYRLNREQ